MHCTKLSLIFYLYTPHDVAVASGTLDVLKDIRVQVAVVLDREPQGASASPTDIFQSSTIPETFLYLPNSHRFRVLMRYSDIIKVQSVTTVDSATPTFAIPGSTTRQVFKTIPLNFDTLYNGAGSTIGAINSNNIAVYMYTDAHSNGVTILGRYRLRYTDA